MIECINSAFNTLDIRGERKLIRIYLIAGSICQLSGVEQIHIRKCGKNMIFRFITFKHIRMHVIQVRKCKGP